MAAPVLLESTLSSVSLVDAPNLQYRLEDLYGDSFIRPSQVSLPQFLASEANTANIQEQIAMRQGKAFTVQSTVMPRRVLGTDTSNTITGTCLASDYAQSFSHTCTVDEAVGVELAEKINLRRNASVLEDMPDVIARRVMHMIADADRHLANDCADQVQGLAGGFSDNDDDGVTANVDASGFDVKAVQTITSGNLDYDAVNEIRYTVDENGGGTAFVFGSTLIQKYFTALQAGCCANTGVDMGALQNALNVNFGASRDIADAIGTDMATSVPDDGFLVLEAGVAQLVRVNIHSGIQIMNNDVLTTVTSPYTGITYDLAAGFGSDSNCYDFSLVLTLPYTVCAIEGDSTVNSHPFQAADPMAGVNGIYTFAVSGNS